MTAPPGLDQAAAPADSGGRGGLFSSAYRRLTIGVLATVLFIAFEGMSVATVMPVAVRELGGIAWYAWGFSAFLITSLLGMVVAGDLCDRRGPRLPFLLSGLIIAAGLVLAGTAQDMAVFVSGRAVQGLGLGLAIVAVYVVIGRAYPESLRPRAFAAISSAWVVPSLVGPALAGYLAEHASWRWAFLGILPLIVPAMLLVLPALGASVAGRPAGAAPLPRRTGLAFVAAIGVALLQYAGQHLVAWSLPVLVLAAALLWRSVPRLLPPGTLTASRGLPSSVLMRGLFAASFFGAEAFIPLMLVRERGLSASGAGLALTGSALGWASGAWFQGRSGLAVRRHVLVRVGSVLVCVAIVAAAVTAATSVTPWLAAVGCVIGGCGMGLGLTSVGVLVLEQSSLAEQGVNSASLQMSDALLSTTSIGLGGVIFAAMHGRAPADRGVFVVIFGVALGIGLLAVVLAPRVRATSGSGPAASRGAIEAAPEA